MNGWHDREPGAHAIPLGQIRADLAVAHEATQPSRPRFELIGIDDLLNRPIPRWLVRGMIVEATQGLIWGAESSGKTFIVLDLALHIAAGAPWHGADVQRGVVVYVVAEGAGGIRKRVAAWCAAHPDLAHAARERFLVVPEAVHLMKGEAGELLKVITAHDAGAPVLIVFDTLARCMVGGDENSAQDMGEAVEQCNLVQRETGAAVVLVHHRGKGEGSRERGSSALAGAVDTSIEVTRLASGIHLKCAKQKDEEPFPDMCFELERVELEPDQDGEPVSSCCVRRVEAPEASANPGGRSVVRRDELIRLLSGKFRGSGATRKELMDETGLAETTLDDCARGLEEKGWVRLDRSRRPLTIHVTDHTPGANPGNPENPGPASGEVRDHRSTNPGTPAPLKGAGSRGSGSTPAAVEGDEDD
ncbi:MAG: AAA family ATPase [bacterium]|nr:AAA family ATPase [bacterium]